MRVTCAAAPRGTNDADCVSGLSLGAFVVIIPRLPTPLRRPNQRQSRQHDRDDQQHRQAAANAVAILQGDEPSPAGMNTEGASYCGASRKPKGCTEYQTANVGEVVDPWAMLNPRKRFTPATISKLRSRRHLGGLKVLRCR